MKKIVILVTVFFIGFILVALKQKASMSTEISRLTFPTLDTKEELQNRPQRQQQTVSMDHESNERFLKAMAKVRAQNQLLLSKINYYDQLRDQLFQNFKKGKISAGLLKEENKKIALLRNTMVEKLITHNRTKL